MYVVEVHECKTCHFYAKSMDGMECDHPYWADKPAYVNMIISRDVRISKQCPLRTGPTTVDFKLCED